LTPAVGSVTDRGGTAYRVRVVVYEQVHPETRAEWRAWLAANHATSPGVWLVQWRTPTGRRRFEYDEAVEEALCFGWIDSLAKRLDDDRSMITMTPRKPTSGWSRSNKERLERLTAAGLMTAAGLRAVEVAKGNGAWELLDDVEALVVPPDLPAALAQDSAAAAGFATMTPSAKKAILFALKTAKKPETRARRLATAVADAAEVGRRRPDSASVT
jgi:uncharacterized protein YdeI (YjbR/CyaY-like superfamily)